MLAGYGSSAAAGKALQSSQKILYVLQRFCLGVEMVESNTNENFWQDFKKDSEILPNLRYFPPKLGVHFRFTKCKVG